MLLKVEKPRSIEDGTHEGVIIGVEYRTKPFEYTDLVIEFEGNKRLKYGVPTMVAPDSTLGKLMVAFGQPLIFGEEIDPEKVFIGQKCKFQTLKSGKFANIVKDSLQHREV